MNWRGIKVLIAVNLQKAINYSVPNGSLIATPPEGGFTARIFTIMM